MHTCIHECTETDLYTCIYWENMLIQNVLRVHASWWCEMKHVCLQADTNTHQLNHVFSEYHLCLFLTILPYRTYGSLKTQCPGVFSRTGVVCAIIINYQTMQLFFFLLFSLSTMCALCCLAAMCALQHFYQSRHTDRHILSRAMQREWTEFNVFDRVSFW